MIKNISRCCQMFFWGKTSHSNIENHCCRHFCPVILLKSQYRCHLPLCFSHTACFWNKQMTPFFFLIVFHYGWKLTRLNKHNLVKIPVLRRLTKWPWSQIPGSMKTMRATVSAPPFWTSFWDRCGRWLHATYGETDAGFISWFRVLLDTDIACTAIRSGSLASLFHYQVLDA